MDQNFAVKLDNVIPITKSVRPEIFSLFWMDTRTGKEHPAGVAFYINDFGEYRLKVDALGDAAIYYARAVGMSDDRIDYRVEAVIKNRDGKFLCRKKVGSGYSDKSTGGLVYMDIGPFCRTLAMRLK